MKYHFGFKVLAFVLAACALMACVGSVVLTATVAENGLYTQTPEEVMQDSLENRAMSLAHHVLERYTAVYLGKCDQNVLSYTNRDFNNRELSGMYDVEPEGWDYRISDLSGEIMQSNYSGKVSGDINTYTFTMSVSYPVHVTAEESQELENRSDWEWRDYYYTETEEHFLYYYTSPTYNVTVRIMPDALRSYLGISQMHLAQLYAIRYWVIAVAAASLLIFILCAIYLCCAAGRSHRHNEIRLKGLTRLPLDLYGGAAGLLCVGLISFGVDFANNILWDTGSLNWLLYLIGGTGMLFAATELDRFIYLIGGAGALFAAAVVAGLWLYAVVAQIKMKNGTWWRHSVIGWCLRKIFKGIRFCFRAVRKLFYMLPLIWQWLLTAVAMVIVPLFCLFLTQNTYNVFRILFALWTVAACLADVAMVCYGAYAFGTLLKGARQMREGNLNAKISTQYLFGAFRDFANQLNALADTAMEAARNQMKSERMKTELITNVSHDIKTPLTSLINYVDLLEKPHTEEEGQQYLEVLSRQSLRLKKLIDDLMDMSKASSGAINVDITQVDAAEVLNQALGEFADKLDTQNLTPVFRQPPQPVMMRCDGRLTWRVMSNLLGNIVKYALPGTRVYMDVVQTESAVLISFKNISREELNVSADELTERFVRGDASRNTDGSGLGLNIAQSLMQLQQGDLRLLVDGDLFKVTLTFPAA